MNHPACVREKPPSCNPGLSRANNGRINSLIAGFWLKGYNTQYYEYEQRRPRILVPKQRLEVMKSENFEVDSACHYLWTMTETKQQSTYKILSPSFCQAFGSREFSEYVGKRSLSVIQS